MPNVALTYTLFFYTLFFYILILYINYYLIIIYFLFKLFLLLKRFIIIFINKKERIEVEVIKKYDYLFSGLIKCEICSSKFRGKKDRGEPIYICSGYNNEGKERCKRSSIKEAQLLDFVRMYCDDKNITIELTNEFMKSIIADIMIGKKKCINIDYIDGYNQYLTDTKGKFRDITHN